MTRPAAITTRPIVHPTELAGQLPATTSMTESRPRERAEDDRNADWNEDEPDPLGPHVLGERTLGICGAASASAPMEIVYRSDLVRSVPPRLPFRSAPRPGQIRSPRT